MNKSTKMWKQKRKTHQISFTWIYENKYQKMQQTKNKQASSNDQTNKTNMKILQLEYYKDQNSKYRLGYPVNDIYITSRINNNNNNRYQFQKTF